MKWSGLEASRCAQGRGRTEHGGESAADAQGRALYLPSARICGHEKCGLSLLGFSGVGVEVSMELLRRASFLGSSESSVADREWSFIGDNIYLINSSTLSHKVLADPRLQAKFARRQTLAWCIDPSLSADDCLALFGDQCITNVHAHDGVTLADLFHVTNAMRFWTFPQRLQSCLAFEAPAAAFIVAHLGAADARAKCPSSAAFLILAGILKTFDDTTNEFRGMNADSEDQRVILGLCKRLKLDPSLCPLTARDRHCLKWFLSAKRMGCLPSKSLTIDKVVMNCFDPLPSLSATADGEHGLFPLLQIYQDGTCKVEIGGEFWSADSGNIPFMKVAAQSLCGEITFVLVHRPPPSFESGSGTSRGDHQLASFSIHTAFVDTSEPLLHFGFKALEPAAPFSLKASAEDVYSFSVFYRVNERTEDLGGLYDDSFVFSSDDSAVHWLAKKHCLCHMMISALLFEEMLLMYARKKNIACSVEQTRLALLLSGGIFSKINSGGSSSDFSIDNAIAVLPTLQTTDNICSVSPKLFVISFPWDGSEGSRHPFYRSAQERLSEIYGFTPSTRTLLLNLSGGEHANFMYSHIPCLALDDFASEKACWPPSLFTVLGIVNALLFWQELGDEFKCVFLVNNSPQAAAKKGHIGMAWRSDVFAGLLSHVLHLLQKLQDMMNETSSDFMKLECEIKAFEKKQKDALAYGNVREAEDVSDKLRLLQEQYMSLGSISSNGSSSSSMLLEGAFYDARDFSHATCPQLMEDVFVRTQLSSLKELSRIALASRCSPPSAVIEITKITVDGFPEPMHDDYRKGREMLPFLFCLTNRVREFVSIASEQGACNPNDPVFFNVNTEFDNDITIMICDKSLKYRSDPSWGDVGLPLAVVHLHTSLLQSGAYKTHSHISSLGSHSVPVDAADMVLLDTNADNLVTLNCRLADTFRVQIQFKVKDVMPANAFLGINAPLAMSSICSLASKTQNKRGGSADVDAVRKQEIKTILEGLNCPPEHEQVSARNTRFSFFSLTSQMTNQNSNISCHDL